MQADGLPDDGADSRESRGQTVLYQPVKYVWAVRTKPQAPQRPRRLRLRSCPHVVHLPARATLGSTFQASRFFGHVNRTQPRVTFFDTSQLL